MRTSRSEGTSENVLAQDSQVPAGLLAAQELVVRGEDEEDVLYDRRA